MFENLLLNRFNTYLILVVLIILAFNPFQFSSYHCTQSLDIKKRGFFFLFTDFTSCSNRWILVWVMKGVDNFVILDLSFQQIYTRFAR